MHYSGCQKQQPNRRHKSISVLITGISWLTTMGTHRCAIYPTCSRRGIFPRILICVFPPTQRISSTILDNCHSYYGIFWFHTRNSGRLRKLPLTSTNGLLISPNIHQQCLREVFAMLSRNRLVISVNKSRVRAAPTSQVLTHWTGLQVAEIDGRAVSDEACLQAHERFVTVFNIRCSTCLLDMLILYHATELQHTSSYSRDAMSPRRTRGETVFPQHHKRKRRYSAN